MTDRERLLDKLRPVPFATACWMPSSISNAEEMVQEALLRLHQELQAGEQIASPRAFAATVTIPASIGLASAQNDRIWTSLIVISIQPTSAQIGGSGCIGTLAVRDEAG